MPTPETDVVEKPKEQTPEQKAKLIEIYGSEDEYKYSQALIQQINADLELREKQSLVFNGLAYSKAYEYNQRKGINYAPPRNKDDDREISLGIVHEKIISFAAIFLKYVWKRNIKCYDDKGRLVKGMGKIYDLAIEFSYQLEQFKKKIAIIYYEVFTQGNAWVLEDWEVMMRETPKAFKKSESGERVEVTPDTMDYTYEFLDGLTYEKGTPEQYRRAVSRLLDGRQVILGNPEIEELQDQPRITLEEEVSALAAEALLGTLNRWKYVPKKREEINLVTGQKLTLFDVSRLKDPKDSFVIHRTYDREGNLMNLFCNGLMMLPRETPLTLFHPRGNYPLSNIPAEKLRGSAYARSIPAKTKFNADFVDWALKMLANKFEQGVDPAILAKGKYTLTRAMFRGGQVTHGVTKDDFEKADPDNKGVTQPEFSFVNLLKEIIQTQTTNPTTSGELSSNATATEISTVENNQRDKLGFLLDGLTYGFMDMCLRRAETIESKYTIKQRETIVDGKKVSVYQNFTVNTSGIENVVVFDELVGGENYDQEGMQDKLFQKAFKDKKAGNPTEYYLANPISLRHNQYNIIIDIMPELKKNSALQAIQMWEDFTQRKNIFGNEASIDAMKKEYLETTGKPDETFTSNLYKQLEEQKNAGMQTAGQPANMGSFGQPARPTIKNAQKINAGIKQ